MAGYNISVSKIKVYWGRLSSRKQVGLGGRKGNKASKHIRNLYEQKNRGSIVQKVDGSER